MVFWNSKFSSVRSLRDQFSNLMLLPWLTASDVLFLLLVRNPRLSPSNSQTCRFSCRITPTMLYKNKFGNSGVSVTEPGNCLCQEGSRLQLCHEKRASFAKSTNIVHKNCKLICKWLTYKLIFKWPLLTKHWAGRLQSMGSLRVGQDWVASLSLFTFMHRRRQWQPTPVFLPGESWGQRSLVGCRLWGRTESDTSETT